MASRVRLDKVGIGFLSVITILCLSLFNTYKANSAVSDRGGNCQKGIALAAADASTMVESFLSSADRGEVQVLGQRVKREEIDPVRISSHLDLNTSTRSVEIYADLKNPAHIPGTSEEVTAISGILSIVGSLKEVHLHVWPKQRVYLEREKLNH